MGEADAVEEAEQVEFRLDAEITKDLVGRKIVDADLDGPDQRAELLGQGAKRRIAMAAKFIQRRRLHVSNDKGDNV